MKKLLVTLLCSIIATTGVAAQSSKTKDLQPSKKTADYCASYFGSDTPQMVRCDALREKCEKISTKGCKEFLKQYRKHLCDVYDC